uniref:Potassium channel tetramerisation-type BTB domain-containing protein n=1 Tax=Branchiostoma floridae TaxID=7739 RepID=C3Y6Y6_BRAFL|eukprot:XP_002608086.1 hypothetical protein BRAFLDRAFT_91436 [Branchiostoma floridae]
MSISDSVVSLNVGGHIYTTARSTLTRFRDSMLGAMFGGDFDALRDDQLVLPEDFKELRLLEMEADFYQIQPLIEAVENYKARLEAGTCDVVFLSVCDGNLSVGASSSEVKGKSKVLRYAVGRYK